MSERTPLERLAEFCATLDLRDIPHDVVEQAKYKVLDSLAVAYAAREHPAVEVAGKLAAHLPEGSSTVVLGTKRLTAPDAAFVNSVAFHALLHDDVDLESGHPACTVIAPALSVAEGCQASGASLLAGIVAGYEAMWRIGGCGAFLMNATRRGFRGNTILGAFGSAAAASRVMGLSAGETAHALAAVASLAAGVLEPLNTGTMERSFQQANNARQGVIAAHLAHSGIDACLTVLDGGTGFYASFAGLEAFPRTALDTLGVEYRLPAAFSKPYPSAGSNTVGIAVAELVRRRLGAQPGAFSHVHLSVLPRFTGVPGYPSIAFAGPFTTLEQALISFPFQVACMLLHGRVDFETIRVNLRSAELADLASLVHLEGVEVPHPLWCRVDVRTSDGRFESATSDEIDWTGFYHTAPAVQEKFTREASPAIGLERAQSLTSSVLGIDQADDIVALRTLLAG